MEIEEIIPGKLCMLFGHKLGPVIGYVEYESGHSTPEDRLWLFRVANSGSSRFARAKNLYEFDQNVFKKEMLIHEKNQLESRLDRIKKELESNEDNK